MFEIYSEVRATLSANVVSAIEGSVLDAVRQCVLTASIEHVITGNTIQYQLCGTLDGILIAKTKLEELLANSIHIRKLAKEATDLDSTTLSEENSSLADEGNTSYDKDKTSYLSDDKERETNASSNGYMSTNTESSTRNLRLKQPLSKKLRIFFKDRPRISQRTRSARLAQQLRALKKAGARGSRPHDPEWLSENLQQMKLATEDSDLDSTGTDVKVKSTPARRPCKARNYEAVSVVKYSCDLCSFKTKRSSHLVKHMAVHEKILCCPHCSYQTTKQRYYDRHQRLHCNKRTFLHQCSECPYKTHRKEHYLRHTKSVHGTERPHLCHVCGKSFKRNDALLQHNLMHAENALENANHKCTICGKQFRSQSHLCEHRAVHSEYRNFLCEICGASFKTKSVHRKHVQSIHRNPRAFSCEVCCKKFNTQYTLKRHKKTHFAKPKLPSNDLSACENNSDVPGIPYNSPQSASESEGVPGTMMRPVISVADPVNVMPAFPVGVNVLGNNVLQPLTPSVIPNPEPSTVLFMNNNVPQL